MAKLQRIVKRGGVEWVQPEGTHFITVDLEIYSKNRLTDLVVSLGDSISVLHEGRWGSRYLAAFTLGNSWQLSVDQEIHRLVALIRSLPPAARRLWTGAQSRVFDIGVQAGLTPHSHALKLSQESIAAVASVQGRITITTYAPEEELSIAARRAKDKG